MKRGLPENVNPFVVLEDVCIDDGILPVFFPKYFSEENKKSGCGTFAQIPILAAALLQEQAENLVRRVFNEGVDGEIGSFAVKENYVHILPADLRRRVRVAKHWNAKGRCSQIDTYYLEQ